MYFPCFSAIKSFHFNHLSRQIEHFVRYLLLFHPSAGHLHFQLLAHIVLKIKQMDFVETFFQRHFPAFSGSTVGAVVVDDRLSVDIEQGTIVRIEIEIIYPRLRNVDIGLECITEMILGGSIGYREILHHTLALLRAVGLEMVGMLELAFVIDVGNTLFFQ